MLNLHFWGRKRVPMILQTEAAECGLACLAMIASYHGYDTDLASLRRRFPTSQQGVNLQQLIQVGQQIQLGSRALRGDIDALTEIKLPVILHWDMNHFVVLVEVRGSQFTIHDPARGEVMLKREELSKHFTGVMLELTPTQMFQQKTEKLRVNLWSFWKSAHGLGGAMTQILLFALVLEMFTIVAPLYQQMVVDNAIVSADRDLLLVLALGFGLLIVVQSAINLARSWAILYLGSTLSVQLVRNLFRHLLRLPMDYFEKRHLGDISSRFGSLDVIQRTLTTSFIASIMDGLLVVVTLVLMFIYSPTLSLVAIIAVLLYAILRALVYRPLRSATEETLLRGAKQQTNFLETVRGVQCVKLFGREGLRQTVYENLLVDRMNADINTQKISIGFQTSNVLIFGIENIIVIYLGARFVLDGSFSIGMLFAFISYKLQFVQRAADLTDKLIELRMLNLHAERIADIALTPVESAIDTALVGSGQMPVDTPSALPPKIEVRNLTFRYSPLERPVIEDLSLTIEPGELAAIVGPSGSGKTTLMKVLLGLLKPEKGEVIIAGQDIHRIDPQQYRGLIGTVMQDDSLFAGSILDNITFFDPVADTQRAMAAAAIAAIHDDIVRMPMQYNTLIGDMGSSLSGGQRQRVVLARAFYKQPKILFLDEATSHVDVMQEKAINDVLKQLGLTIVMIAHRPETIDAAHRKINIVR
ncbi:MAG: peptidase domain-containing ABC transporter [Rhodocyclaceae bacterium]|nr:peptidase domain-containing ABC transporter [Rhodocyclaceae bacterium]MCA3169076.1 peptidase domain-containing ABC transporter [Burkholderiales bacterium]MCA3019404.1 peptidase domain-containing ABC transporter [Rhodocyclaceae bacterium]MCA3030819.1 peptidase domain-containing ABC transporter [Rhodocyclaceae bacterium]MCA3038319.1 peptidase domain-containing ABC transporter [Rhodocyclaceae bacterium]